MQTIVSMNLEGRSTLPAAARKRLGVSGEAQFEIEVCADAIILRPVAVLSRGDAWAYTSGHRRLPDQAYRDSREGRARQISESDLERLGEHK